MHTWECSYEIEGWDRWLMIRLMGKLIIIIIDTIFFTITLLHHLYFLSPSHLLHLLTWYHMLITIWHGWMLLLLLLLYHSDHTYHYDTKASSSIYLHIYEDRRHELSILLFPSNQIRWSTAFHLSTNAFEYIHSSIYL